MRVVAIVFLVALPANIFAVSPPLQFVNQPNTQLKQLAAMANGDVLISGWYSTVNCANTLYNCVQPPSPLLYGAAPSGNGISYGTNQFGSGNTAITCATVDAAGDVWVAGWTNSDDFQLVKPLYSMKTPYDEITFVAKFSGGSMAFSTFLGSQAPLSIPTTVAADNAGNVYLAGPTEDPSFPVTGPTFGEGAPTHQPFAQPACAFVVKIAADGSKIVFSRLLGGGIFACSGSVCLTGAVSTTPYASSVDGNGNLTIAGGTTATDFPVTANAYQTTGSGFVSRISADGSQLLWSTLFGNASSELLPVATSVTSIALDSTGDVFFCGSTIAGIAATPGALEPTLPPNPSFSFLNGFVAELSSSGSKLVYATNLGGSNGATLAGLTLDASGNVWIAGNNKSPEFPGMPNTPPAGLDFALELNASGTAVEQIFELIPGTATVAPVFDTNGNLVLAGVAGNLLRLNPSTVLTTPAILAVANAAALKSSAVLAPGEIVSLFGVGLGPATGVISGPTGGQYPTELGGVMVDFHSTAFPQSYFAPILYAGPDQINFQTPFELPSEFTMTVTTPGGVLPPITMLSGPSIGIFQQAGTNFAAALNADGSVNSASNPAQVGSVVSIFVTGLGEASQNLADGALTPLIPNYIFLNEAEMAGTGNVNLQFIPVLYAGTAPGEINGVAQINVQLPFGNNPDIAAIELLGANAGTSNTVAVYTH